jgi:hypothetical protein
MMARNFFVALGMLAVILVLLSAVLLAVFTGVDVFKPQPVIQGSPPPSIQPSPQPSPQPEPQPAPEPVPPLVENTSDISNNWAGYVVESSFGRPQAYAVTNVSAMWTVPYVDCTDSSNSSSSFWVGIGGYSERSIEQIGTDSDCSGGSPVYFSWYEMYPRNPASINTKINPGDLIYAEVSYLGQGRFRLSLSDLTSSFSFSTVETNARAGRFSAEWVAEAPALARRILPLSPFGLFQFRNALVTVNGETGTISGPGWQDIPVVMKSRSGQVKAAPSGLVMDGSGFFVEWKSAQ